VKGLGDLTHPLQLSELDIQVVGGSFARRDFGID